VVLSSPAGNHMHTV